MTRAGYSDDCDNWDLIRWRGQVASAIRGKRGQKFLRELIAALDALPRKRLIKNELWNGEACALGAVAVARGVDVITLDTEDNRGIARLFGISDRLVMEIEFENDEALAYYSPEERWYRMREWAVRHLIDKP